MYHEDNNSLSSSSSGGNHQRPFNGFEINFSGDDTSCIPGFDYKEDGDYLLELEDTELNSVALQIEQQLYQTYMRMDTRHQITEEFVQPWEYKESFPQSEYCQPSSSSSSLRSLSMTSPENSTLVNKASSSLVSPVNAPKEEITPKQALPPTTSIPAGDPYHDIQFPTPNSEDLVITRAMMAVISSTSSSSSSSSMLQLAQTCEHRAMCPLGPFKPYTSALAPKFQLKKSLCGQKMIKTSMSILRRISLMKEGVQKKEFQSTSQQTDHMISERRRREKLNGSFHTLRLLLPPGTKKDKASVLCKTKDYLKTLTAEIFELQKNNRMLEMHLPPKAEIKEDGGGTIERVNIQIIKASQLVTGVQRIDLKITVSFEGDIIELVLNMLECLKGMGFSSFVSLDANIYSQHSNLFAWVTVKLDIQSSGWDEVSFKEAMTRAVDLAALTP